MPSFTKALPRLGGGLVPKPAVSVTDSGKSDLLMRFFESDWFDAWIALTYVAPGSEGCSGVEVAGVRAVRRFGTDWGHPGEWVWLEWRVGMLWEVLLPGRSRQSDASGPCIGATVRARAGFKTGRLQLMPLGYYYVQH